MKPTEKSVKLTEYFIQNSNLYRRTASMSVNRPDYQLVNNNTLMSFYISIFPFHDRNIIFWHDMNKISFENFFEQIPKQHQESLIFNLDLFT